MSEESNRTLALLQELAILKEAKENGERSSLTKQRREEIGRELKELALQKKNAQQ